jgi:hypothetical protein
MNSERKRKQNVVNIHAKNNTVISFLPLNGINRYSDELMQIFLNICMHTFNIAKDEQKCG